MFNPIVGKVEVLILIKYGILWIITNEITLPIISRRRIGYNKLQKNLQPRSRRGSKTIKQKLGR
jgi:hypothetical protein